LDGNRPPSAAINGDKSGVYWGQNPTLGSGWHSSTSESLPQTLTINFGTTRTINQVNVYGVQNDYTNPIPNPDETTPATLYGLVDFHVQYDTGGGQFADIANGKGSVTGNDKVLKRLFFNPITTSAIRIVVTNGGGGYARIVEVEALTPFD